METDQTLDRAFNRDKEKHGDMVGGDDGVRRMRIIPRDCRKSSTGLLWISGGVVLTFMFVISYFLAAYKSGSWIGFKWAEQSDNLLNNHHNHNHNHPSTISSFIDTTTSPSDHPDKPNPFEFTLKHIYHHNTEKKPLVHKRLDITDAWLKKAEEEWWARIEIEDELLNASTESDSSKRTSERTSTSSNSFNRLKTFSFSQKYPLKLASSPKKIKRIADQTPDTMEAYLEFTRSPQAKETKFIMDFDWIDHDVPIPDVTDRNTIITLAYMASDAYVDIPHTGDWTNVSDPWNNESSLGLGWQEDGVRGHIFANADDSIAVISIKGTSAAIFDSGGDTAPNDKINDNLLFSCCCARISYLWNTVCDCFTGDSYSCNQECLEEQLYSEDRYYRAVLDIYRNVTSLYPKAAIWVTGHSLGGSLAALLGRTYGLPTIGFEAPPEQLATKRLHLPQPPGIPPWEDHVWHFGHTADPVFMGVCNGAGSTCWIAGYAMETQCHTGLQCVYDVVEDLGWHVSMVNHRIHVVIDDVILAYNDTPTCIVPPPCEDCFNWNFVYPSIPDPPSSTTTSISTTTTSSKTTSLITSPGPPSDTGTPEKCLRRSWYGRCIEYGPVDPPEDDDDPDPGNGDFGHFMHHT